MSSRSTLQRQISMGSSFQGEKAGLRHRLGEPLAQVEDLQAEHICAILKTDPHKGLSHDKAKERLLKDGPNELTQEPRLGLLMLFLLQLTSARVAFRGSDRLLELVSHLFLKGLEHHIHPKQVSNGF